jgi:hypothetical protein
VVVQPPHQKQLSYPDVLGDYITRTSDLAYVQLHFVPEIRNFESNGMDRGTNAGPGKRPFVPWRVPVSMDVEKDRCGFDAFSGPDCTEPEGIGGCRHTGQRKADRANRF